MTNISELLGVTLTSIEVDKNKEYIYFKAGSTVWSMYHAQNCCESVLVEDICGDLDDLIGHPILLAEEVVKSSDEDIELELERDSESYTWTFYKLATIRGSVTIRWFGSSNGYYSERVSFEKILDQHQSY